LFGEDLNVAVQDTLVVSELGEGSSGLSPLALVSSKGSLLVSDLVSEVSESSSDVTSTSLDLVDVIFSSGLGSVEGGQLDIESVDGASVSVDGGSGGLEEGLGISNGLWCGVLESKDFVEGGVESALFSNGIVQFSSELVDSVSDGVDCSSGGSNLSWPVVEDGLGVGDGLLEGSSLGVSGIDSSVGVSDLDVDVVDVVVDLIELLDGIVDSWSSTVQIVLKISDLVVQVVDVVIVGIDLGLEVVDVGGDDSDLTVVVVSVIVGLSEAGSG